MSKKGTYNGPFFNSFATRIHGTPIYFGVLIGTQAEDGCLRDAIFAAPTPPRPGEDGKAIPTPKGIVALAKSKDASDFALWAQQHGEALRKLLPGGLEPCGCFAVAPEADAKELAPMLSTVLKGIAEPLVLTVDPGTQKLSFWQHSGGAKPALRPAQLKADAHKEALLLSCTTPVDIFLPQSADWEGEVSGSVTDELISDVEKGVEQVLKSTSVGVETAAGAPLSLVDFASEASVSSVMPKGSQELRVAFLHNGSVTFVAPNPEERPLIRLRCLLVGTAVLLRRRGELRHSIEALRSALAASVGNRLQLALEESEGSIKGCLFLPWRALCKPEGSDLPFWCGDYCMPDEDIAAARERLGALLGMPESSFEAAPEHLDERAILRHNHAGTYDLPRSEEDKPSSTNRGSGSLTTPNFYVIAVIAILVPVLLAALVPLILKS